MSKKSKIIYSVIAVLIVVVLGILIGTTVKNGVKQTIDENAADVEAIKLPKKKELTNGIGNNIEQLDNLTDKYVLRNYEFGEDGKSITYYYQTHLATTGERLMLKVEAMSEDDYNAKCPSVNIKTDSYAGKELTFAARTLYYVPDDFEMNDAIQQLIDEGYAEIEYGNTMDEAIDMQKICWYEDGFAYTITAYYHSFTFEDLTELAHYYIDNRK
jgi:hypothetical protein